MKGQYDDQHSTKFPRLLQWQWHLGSYQQLSNLTQWEIIWSWKPIRLPEDSEDMDLRGEPTTAALLYRYSS